MPETTTAFDFREIVDNSGWNIYGVRLDGKRPQTDIPQHLLQQAPDKNSKLPAADLNLGKTVVAVRLLGYKPEYKTTLDIIIDNWFSPQRMPFAHDLGKSQEALAELKQVISDFFAKKGQEELDAMWERGEMTEEKLKSFETLHSYSKCLE